jgi:hypothetical protein
VAGAKDADQQQQHAAPQHAAKKQKTTSNAAADAGAAAATAVIRPSLLTPESRQQLRAQLEAAQPYTHVVLRELCDPALLAAVRHEVIHNISATYKETDLFKVFQTGVRVCGCSRGAAAHHAQSVHVLHM